MNQQRETSLLRGSKGRVISTWTPKSPHCGRHTVKMDWQAIGRPRRHAVLGWCRTTRSTRVAMASLCRMAASQGAEGCVSSSSLQTHAMHCAHKQVCPSLLV